MSTPAPEVTPPFGRTRHPYFMHDMIRRQPVALQATHTLNVDAVAATPLPAPNRPILFVGTGTSYHAAEASARSAEEDGFAPTQCLARMAFEVANAPDRFSDAGLAVVFSESGDTRVTNEALTALKQRSIPTILITATEHGPASSIADCVLLTRYAEETSWTHTVSYTSALAASAALRHRWRKDGRPIPWDGDLLEGAANQALALENAVVEFIDSIAGRSEIVLLGTGSAETTAREGALKLREAAGRFACTNGTEEFLHGTLPSVGASCAVIGLSRTERERERSLTALHAATQVGAFPLLIDSSDGPAAIAPITIWKVPSAGEGSLPLLQVIPLQLLAYWLAVSDGRNPDVMGNDDPRYLAARRTFQI